MAASVKLLYFDIASTAAASSPATKMSKAPRPARNPIPGRASD
jgi:hypothetical protein